MPEITIRSTKSEDIESLSVFEHGYYTDYVWQMSLDISSEKVQTTFQRVRLPRKVFVSYPRKRETIFEELENPSKNVREAVALVFRRLFEEHQIDIENEITKFLYKLDSKLWRERKKFFTLTV